MAIDLAAALAAAFERNGEPIGVQPMTLVNYTPTTRTSGALSDGRNPTATSYACSGFVELLEQRHVQGAQLVRGTDVRISLLGASIAGGVKPQSGSRITVPGGPHAGTYIVVDDGVAVDGVGAVYVCACRR